MQESPGPGQLAETVSESPDLMLFVIHTTDGSSDSQDFLNYQLTPGIMGRYLWIWGRSPGGRIGHPSGGGNLRLGIGRSS